jgi:hypothetical protein
MFGFVPEELERRVVGLPDAWKSGKYAAVAWEVVAHYADLQLHESMFSSFQIQDSDMTEIRLIWLGASLFSVRNDAIMPELCRRLKEREMRSTFFEISAASFCKELGYYVAPSQGKPKLGLDFDFLIKGTRTEPHINVEVTELQASSFDVRRMVNSLNNKRKQLPKNEPSILICYLPHTWTDNAASFDAGLDEVADRFFRGSKRVNALCFSVEIFIPAIRVHSVRFIAHWNKAAGHRSESLESILIAYHKKLGPSPTYEETQFGRIHEFKCWVDSLIP